MEKWIEDAMNEARKKVDEMEPVAKRIFGLLDEFGERLLDEWRMQIGDRATYEIVQFVTRSKTASNSVWELCRCFFSVGYMFGKHDIEINYDYGKQSES